MPAKNKLYGSTEPRIFTPPLRKLTEKTSLGGECIRFTRDVLELTLMPWQEFFLWHALELHPTEVDDDGEPTFRFRKIILLVGRQNGKSTVMQALTLWRMYIDRCSLVIGTAQDLEVAESLWGESVEMVEETEELKVQIGKIERQPGRKKFRLRTGEEYKVKAATRRGGRGLSGELVLLDELREHQTWDAWAAVTKTTNAKARAQVYGISNAGDATSIVLRYLRKKAHEELGDPDGINRADNPEDLLTDEVADDDDEIDIDSGLGIFEWSAPPGSNVRDRNGWVASSPALGYRVLESTLAGDAETDPEWVFRTEVMCQWSDGTLEGPFPPGTWEACADEGSVPPDDADVKLCLEVSWDRTRTHIGLAALREDGVPHVELIASRAGTDWPVSWLTSDERLDVIKSAPVVIQKGSPAHTLIEPLREAGIDVVEWSGEDVPTGTGALYDAVREANEGEPGLWHRNQPALNLAAALAVPKMTSKGAFMWDGAKSPADIGPLKAVTGALWLLTRSEPAKTASAYSDHDFIVI